MKIFYLSTLLLFSIVFVHVTAFSQWYQLNSGTTNHLNSVFFTDENTGYVVGNNGTILKTNDGGDTWAPKISGTNSTLASVFFPSADTGYIVGYNFATDHVILKTIDAGENWQLVSTGITDAFELHSVHFTSNDTGFVVGHDLNYTRGIVLKTTDGGNNWVVKIFYGNSNAWPLTSVYFYNSEIGCAVGWCSTVLMTWDAGETWWLETDPPSTMIQLNSVFIVSPNKLYTVGQSGTVLSYFPETNLSVSGGWLSSVFFTSIDTGYIAVQPGIYKTTNSGTTFEYQYLAPLESFECIFFINNHIGYSVGSNGIIFKTTNGGGSVGISDNTIPYSDIKIFVDHSNQFVEISIENDLLKSFYELYNIEGKLISKDEITQPKEKINIKNLPGGVYLVRAHNNGVFKTMKFVKQ